MREELRVTFDVLRTSYMLKLSTYVDLLSRVRSVFMNVSLLPTQN